MDENYLQHDVIRFKGPRMRDDLVAFGVIRSALLNGQARADPSF
jgi:hypothetical protein